LEDILLTNFYENLETGKRDEEILPVQFLITLRMLQILSTEYRTYFNRIIFEKINRSPVRIINILGVKLPSENGQR